MALAFKSRLQKASNMSLISPEYGFKQLGERRLVKASDPSKNNRHMLDNGRACFFRHSRLFWHDLFFIHSEHDSVKDLFCYAFGTIDEFVLERARELEC